MLLTRNEAIAGQWKVANGEVVIVDGRIQNNPFAKQMRSSMAVQWMLQNQGRVNARLGKLIHDYGIQGGDYQDCFDFAIEYFTDRDSRVFRKNFHGKGTSYNVGAYVVSNLDNVVKSYQSKLMPKDVKVVPMLNADESERNFSGQLGESITKDTDITPEVTLTLCDVEYWDNYFLGIMDWFMEHVEEYSYTPFAYEEFVYYMFMQNRHNDLQEQLLSSAMYCGMGKALAEYVLKNITLDRERKKKWVTPFVRGIVELLDAVKLGWKPKSMREEV
ncbi:hypothetical protein [Bacillus thuringiensis]|uniref:hypothetical protein n=1 Tax=Bacillus thuringiensis TaxID=1428 RepID=UPI000BFE0920|nr:hypothetical protein [Bacillus thuringiensis]PGT90149.1 hypothetical protein COD17_10400 [Bacillus thuringiensis]